MQVYSAFQKIFLVIVARGIDGGGSSHTRRDDSGIMNLTKTVKM